MLDSHLFKLKVGPIIGRRHLEQTYDWRGSLLGRTFIFLDTLDRYLLGGRSTLFHRSVELATSRVDPRPPILELLRQVLVLVLAVAFWRETSPVPILALWYILLVSLVCQQEHLVSAIFQVDDSGLETEGFDGFDVSIHGLLPLAQHRLHLSCFFILFGR